MKKTIFSLPGDVYRELPKVVTQYFPKNRFSFSYLFSRNSAKTKKGEKLGFLTLVLYLAPHDTIGVNHCTSSSLQCRTGCLWGAGRLGLESGRRATIARSLYLHFFPTLFFAKVFEEVARSKRFAARHGMKVAIRLNGTSDIPWESKRYHYLLPTLMNTYPDVQVYDYTKHIGRCVNGYRRKHSVSGYHLTFSYNGYNWAACEKALADKCNVAVCFDGKMPDNYRGYPVTEGDRHDLRFLDGVGKIVGLSYKLPKPLNSGGTIPASSLPDFVIPV